MTKCLIQFSLKGNSGSNLLQCSRYRKVMEINISEEQETSMRSDTPKRETFIEVIIFGIFDLFIWHMSYGMKSIYVPSDRTNTSWWIHFSIMAMMLCNERREYQIILTGDQGSLYTSQYTDLSLIYSNFKNVSASFFLSVDCKSV